MEVGDWTIKIQAFAIFANHMSDERPISEFIKNSQNITISKQQPNKKE